MADTRLFSLEGGRRPHPAVERWFQSRPPILGAFAKQWFDEMRQCGPDVFEVLHDGHPTACVGNLAFGYVNAFRDHVNVGFFLGSSLDDPKRLLEGSGRFMRHVKICVGEAVDEGRLRALVVAAYADMKSRLLERDAGAKA